VLECDRALVRAMALEALSEQRAGRLRAILSRMTARWQLMPITREVIGRARQPFPGEPIRSLDAIHLASALLASDSLPDLSLLSLDHRVRASAQRLGLQVVPE